MALFNEILVGRFQNFITKTFGMKGPAPAPQLATEVSIGMPLFHGAEFRFQEGWNLYGTSVVTIGAAGNNSGFELRNPVSSGVIAVIEKMCAAPNGAAAARMDFQIGRPGTDFATILPPRGRDGRVTTGSAMVASSGIVNFGQIGTTLLQIWTPNNTTVIVPQTDDEQWVLTPGDAIAMLDNTQNENATFSCLWRERPIEDSERK